MAGRDRIEACADLPTLERWLERDLAERVRPTSRTLSGEDSGPAEDAEQEAKAGGDTVGNP